MMQLTRGTKCQNIQNFARQRGGKEIDESEAAVGLEDEAQRQRPRGRDEHGHAQAAEGAWDPGPNGYAPVVGEAVQSAVGGRGGGRRTEDVHKLRRLSFVTMICP